MDQKKKKKICGILGIDEACLNININSELNATFYKQYDECSGCPFIEPEPLNDFFNNSFVIDTRYGAKFLIQAENSSCIASEHLREHGWYELNVTMPDPSCNITENATCLSCDLNATTLPDAVTTYLPIIVAACIYIGLALLYLISKALYRIMRRDSQNDSFVGSTTSCSNEPSIQNASSTSLPNEGTPVPPVKKRLRSLDTFRGIAIVVMIFVNYGGGKYFFFDHLPWNGLSVADLVFPWFIWIMGVSMSMSLRSLIKRSVSKWRITWKLVKRSLILFALGIILNTSYGANDMKFLRVPGVLQRFAISYFVVGFVHMFFAKPADSHTEVRWSAVRDVFLYWGEWLIMLSLLLIYLCLTFLLPVPGCPTGYLGPGGLHDDSAYYNCTGGAAGYIDRTFFGTRHIYSNPTCKALYMTSVPYDPEGLIGSITSIFLVFLGLQAGKILHTYSCWKERLSRWISWSIITGVIAAILCKASKNDGWIPVNKNLWSLSFILTTGCMAFFLLSVCFYIQDVKQWWNGAPFFYPGMNSILLYVGHQLTGQLFPWQFKAENTHGAELAMDLWGTSLWVFIAYILYRKKVFLAI